jgi:carboxymethylenebutenolidase
MQTQDLEQGFLAHSDAGATPGVVMVPDVWGLSDHYRDLAGRLAGEGFAVLVVDPYRKTGQPEISSPAEALTWIRELSDPVVLETLQEARDLLAGHAAVGGHAGQPAAGGRKIGITGFCMGGQYAILGACGCRGFAACVPFYGMLRYAEGLDPARKPRSPLEALAELPCPLLGLYGEDDHLIPVSDVRELEQRVEKGGGEVKLYPGAGHAFMNETRPEMYRADAARDAWPRMVAFFRRHLTT